MNSNTRAALDKFAMKVAHMAEGCVHQLGTQEAGNIIEACNELSRALQHDETIIESGRNEEH